jgi:protein-S-isoprenylcysteine O-methyltransferase Ste14
MSNTDLWLYAVHGAFWATFGLTKALARRPSSAAPDANPPRAGTQATAAHSRSLVLVHMVAFGLMYFGVGNAVLPNRVPLWFPGQRMLGFLVITVGAAFMCWALLYFRSWRFRAQLDAGHELASGGPFRYVRHPIYLGLNLLALGTAIWVPTTLTWIATLMMVIGSDLRGRAEEGLLRQVFGDTYAAYCARTSRFLPGVY